jgi:hypothetical protein
LASQARHESGAQQETFAAAKRGLGFGPFWSDGYFRQKVLETFNRDGDT